MEALSLNSAIIEKTRELCSLLLESSDYRDNVKKIESFFDDADAQSTYRAFAKLGEELHQKQHAGELTETDIELYEKKQAELRENETIDAFMEAEGNLNAIVRQISKHVGKTLELGRLPEPADMDESGCCGDSGCGCH